MPADDEKPADATEEPQSAPAEQPAEKLAAEQPPAEKPAAEQPAAEQPAAEQPAAEQPAAEQPEGRRRFWPWGRKKEAAVAAAAATSAAGTPATEQPAAGAPAAEQTPAEEPATDAAPPAQEPEAEMTQPGEEPATDAVPLAEDSAAEMPAEESPAPATEELPADAPSADAPVDAPPTDAFALPEGQTGPVPLPESQLLAEGSAAEIDMGPERRFNWWLFWGVTLALLLVGAIGFGYWWLTERPIAVPDVTGDQVAQATQRINDAGLRLGKVSEVATDAAPTGNVIEQKPAAGTEMKPGESISLVVAAPADRSKVPDVTGKSIADADAALATARLATYRVETFSTTATVGVVIGQVPSAGVMLVPGSYVAVSVSKGPAPTQVIVPNLLGMNGDDAKATLEALGLKGAGYRAIEPSTAVGVIFKQNPTASTRVTPETTVQYLISDGPGTANVTVPTLTGKTRKAAEKELKDLGLKPAVRVVPSATAVKDTVFQQMPPAGDKVGPGTTVGLLVSSGALVDGPVPDVMGKSSAEASKTIGAAGFKPVILEVVADGQPKGQVFAQFPPAGTGWSAKLPVIALVAKQ